VVSVQPSVGQAGGFLIRLARGSGPGPHGKGTVFGPYAEEELEARFADVLAGLQAEGFLPSGVGDLLLALESPQPAVRARAALGLGWRRAGEAVEPILAAIPKAVDEICSYLDALGAIGDPRALPILREQASRKLLSRRRSAVEALRNLGDTAGLAAARLQALERLPPSVRQVLEALDQENVDLGPVQTLAQAVLALEGPQRGLALDTLYELAAPVTVAAVRTALGQIAFDQAHHWRYVKSIHKRAMLRHDYSMVGWLSHAIEVQGRSSTGTEATVKSGYDGVVRPVRIFGRKTQNFMRRLSWRYLRLLAAYRPEAYPAAAAEALVAYTPEDLDEPQGLYGSLARCYLLQRILWGAGKRLVLSERSLRFRFQSAQDTQPPAQVREEPYPHLWDARPSAYLRILGAAQLPEVQAFAVRAVESRHPEVLYQASHTQILALLQAPYEPTVRLGLKELERRFDPEHPDWGLLGQLLGDDRPAARELGERWLRLTAPMWSRDPARTMTWLALPQASSRALAAELAIAAIQADPGLRRALAEQILKVFQSAQAEDVVDGHVMVARAALLDDLASLLSTQALVEWILCGPEPTLGIAGELLGRCPEAAAELGLERLAMLAHHDIAAIRAGAHRLIRGMEAHLRDDPSLLMALVESDWEDTRQVAVDLLRATLRPESLDLERLLGLLDSGQAEVQNLGQELARLRLASLPADELAYRLVQHPHPNMRRFALELVLGHLPDGGEPLARLEAFFRTALFDLWPDRRLKERVLDFLSERGLRDEHQAGVAGRILSDVARVQGRSDFERALVALVRLKLAFPDLAVPISLNMEGVA
jgi:hypothetical protein